MTLTTDQVKWNRLAWKTQRELEIRFDLAPTTHVDIRWNLKGRTVAGWSVTESPTERYIRLNTQWAEVLADTFHEVVVHEVCHYITTSRRMVVQPHPNHMGDWTAHGPAWKQAMRACGLKPNRVFEPTTEQLAMVPLARKVQRVIVFCGCSSHEVTRARAAKGLLQCTRCGNKCYTGTELKAQRLQATKQRTRT